jgi:hypothetical protein
MRLSLISRNKVLELATQARVVDAHSTLTPENIQAFVQLLDEWQVASEKRARDSFKVQKQLVYEMAVLLQDMKDHDGPVIPPNWVNELVTLAQTLEAEVN